MAVVIVTVLLELICYEQLLVTPSTSNNIIIATNSSNMRIPTLRKAHSALSLKTTQDRQQDHQAYSHHSAAPAMGLASPTAILDAYGRPSIDSVAAAAGKKRERAAVTTAAVMEHDEDDTAFSHHTHAQGELFLHFAPVMPVEASTGFLFSRALLVGPTKPKIHYQARANEVYSLLFPSLS